MATPVLIVQGGQFGSEAKGAVAHALCKQRRIKWACRTGSINAGHTVVEEDGKKLVYQQLPTAAALPNVNLVIGPGAYVHHETLMYELGQSPPRDGLHDVLVDRNCGVHLDQYTDEAKEAARNLKIGATGKGCAEAIIHKIKDRGVGEALLYRNFCQRSVSLQFTLVDTAEVLTDAYHNGESIMLEGTQGTLLDMHTGPYPFTTSRQTISSAWVAESGLSPSLDYEICLVVRTFPIRVAGRSGPMNGEIRWTDLARRMNVRLVNHGIEPIVPEDVLQNYECLLELAESKRRRRGESESEVSLMSATDAILSLPDQSRTALLKLFETTTVTKRLRRIAEIDRTQLRTTVYKEQPEYVALTFLNYVFPELATCHNPSKELHAEAQNYVLGLSSDIGCSIRYVSLGPKASDLIEV